jgi:hypothetical protein
LDAGSQGQLLTVWRDRDAFAAARPAFEAAVGTAAAWVGYHRATHAPKKPLWRRLTWGWWAALLAGAVAVYGNLDKARSAWADLFGPAQFRVRRLGLPVDVCVGDPFKFEARVANTRWTPGSCNFDFEKVTGADPKDVVLNDLTGELRTAVKEGSEARVEVSGRGLRPGTFPLRLKGSAAAGSLYPDEKPFEDEVATLKVWAVLAIGKGTADPDRNDRKHCRARFVVSPGRESPGLDLQATLLNEPGVQITHVLSETARPPTPLHDEGVSSVRWMTPKVAAFRDERVVLFLTSVAGPKSPAEWERIVGQVRVE